jgi:hypothetical protein
MQSILVIKIFLKQLQDGKCNFKGDQMSLRKISPKISPNLFFYKTNKNSWKRVAQEFRLLQ